MLLKENLFSENLLFLRTHSKLDPITWEPIHPSVRLDQLRYDLGVNGNLGGKYYILLGCIGFTWPPGVKSYRDIVKGSVGHFRAYCLSGGKQWVEYDGMTATRVKKRQIF